MIPIIDTHQHLWDLKKFKLSWLKEGDPLGSRYAIKYAEATKGLNVVKAVYMEVDVVPEQQQAEVDYLIELCKAAKTPTVAAVVSGRPASEGFEKYVRQFKSSPYIKGIRQVIHVEGTPGGYCLKKIHSGYSLAGRFGLEFRHLYTATNWAICRKLVEECPGTRFILDHCGNANVQAKDRMQWKKDMELLGTKKNLVCKVSGIVASAAKGKWAAEDLAPIVNHTIASFGWDRVMFGGDEGPFVRWQQATNNGWRP